MNRWTSALPWVLVAALTTTCLVALGVAVLDPAPRAAETALTGLVDRTPVPGHSPDYYPDYSDDESEEDAADSDEDPEEAGSDEKQAEPRKKRRNRRTPTPVRRQSGSAPADRAGDAPRRTTCVPMPELTELTVLTFNIHAGIGPRGADLAGIAREIRAADADVVLLQEVDRFRPRTGFVDTPAWLASQLGMQHAFAPNMTYPGVGGRARQEYGIATLSRFPMTEAEHLRLPNLPGKEQRGVLRTRVRVGSEEVDVYNTHLEHTSPALRERQARAVVDLTERGDRPVVVGGDFNTTQGTPPHQVMTSRLQDMWTKIGEGRGLTGARARIDYVFAEEALVPVSAQVMPTAISDHRGVAVKMLVSGMAPCRSWADAFGRR